MSDRLLDQIANWRRQLLDLSKRNRLISCPLGIRSFIELAHPDVDAVWRQIAVSNGTMRFVRKRDLFEAPDESDDPVEETNGLIVYGEDAKHGSEKGSEKKEKIYTLQECIESPRLSKSHLLTNLTDRSLASRLTRLSWAAETSQAEQGVNILFLAFGFLKWFESPDSLHELYAPLMLVPVELQRTGVRAEWTISEYEDEVIENNCLQEKLRNEFGFELPGFPEDGLESQGSRRAYLELVRNQLISNPNTSRWGVVDRVLLGTFAFQKIAMWKDLGINSARIAEHPLCRAIGGDLAVNPVQAVKVPPLHEFDELIHPKDLHTILDCDSSQLEAIYAVKKGTSLVLDGPPGTGKSQTIANLIAEFLADGKTVLFVSEKMAALEVVKRRLDLAGLGDFVLECHSHSANKKEILHELGRCLDLPSPRVRDQSEHLDRLFETRRQLNTYVQSLHAPQSALNISPFVAHSRLAAVLDAPAIEWTDSSILERDQRWLDSVSRTIAELPRYSHLIATIENHPWRTCKLVGYSLGAHDDLKRLLQDLGNVCNQVFQSLQSEIIRGLGLGKATPRTIQDIVATVDELLQLPLLPQEWIRSESSKYAAEMRLIADKMESIQDLRNRLADFEDHALKESMRELLVNLSTDGIRAWTYIRSPQKTIRSQLKQIDHLLELLGPLIESVDALTLSLQDFGTALGFPFGPVTSLTVVERLVELGKWVGTNGHLLPGWFEELRRSELLRFIPSLKAEEQAIATKLEGLDKRLADSASLAPCEHWITELKSFNPAEVDEARSVHNRLSGRFVDLAFTPEGEAMAEESLQFRPWYTRILGGWAETRKRVQKFYSISPPATDGQLLADMESLCEFHSKYKPIWARWCNFRNRIQSMYREQVPDSLVALQADITQLVELQARKQALEQRLDPFRVDLPCNDDNGYDWSRLEQGLQLLEQLKALGLRMSDRLRRVLSSAGTFRQRDVQQAADNLCGIVHRLNQLADSIKGEISLGRIGDPAVPFQRLGLESLKVFLEELRSELRTKRSSAAEICQILRPASDPLLSDVSQFVMDLEAYLQARDAVKPSWQSVHSRIGESSEPLEVNCFALIQIATSLTRIADTYGNKTPENVVLIVGNEAIRQQLSMERDSINEVIARFWEPIQLRLTAAFDVEQTVAKGTSVSDLTFDELATWSRDQIEALPQLQDWMRFKDLRLSLRDLGASHVLKHVLKGSIDSKAALPAFLARFYRNWLDAIYRKDDCLRTFQSVTHDESVTRFCELDRRVISGGGRRVAEFQLTKQDRPRRNELAPKDSEIRILMHQASLKRRHWPLRKLFSQIPTVLPRIKPCVMMSPLAVSTYFDSSKLQFDVVIFDEASQIRPFDAIGAIYRGKQLVVAGDPRQLPPTSFFDKLIANDESEEDDDGDAILGHIEDFESILDVCTAIGLPRRRLCWHYRSRREPLIAFSNRHFYDSELVTFPSVYDFSDKSPVTLDYCPLGRWKTGRSGGFNPVEVARVVELIVQHYRETPRLSLGVITFNQRQQFQIMDELERVSQCYPELSGALNGEGSEPLFIKNLENVQGDERDRIIISVAYGFDDDGRFAMRFGPLNQQGGERRLNVAVTRARQQIVVVTSIRANHINLGSTQARGVQLLKSYLEFAEFGASQEVLSDAKQHHEEDFQFEDEVLRVLKTQGYDVHRRIGCGTSPIDLAIVHPKSPGMYALGLECDGTAYRLAQTARDRERLRGQVLRGLGWRMERIWSADWVANREVQLARIESKFQECLVQQLDVEEIGYTGDESDQEVIDADFEPVLEEELLLEESDLGDIKMPFRFSKIDDVSDAILNQALVDMVRNSGRSEQDSLIRAVAHSLGFRRLGKKIEERITRAIRSLVRRKQLVRDDDRWLSVP